MNLQLKYPDTLTFVKVESDGYSDKTSVQQVDIPCIFVQNTSMGHSNHQDSMNSDAICYPDFTHDFIEENFNRLEGMYLISSAFGEDTWYKVESATVNRDHLLNNQIDNIELQLKLTRPIAGVS